MHVGIALGIPGILLPRKVGKNGELAFQPHLLALVAHDLPGTGPWDGTRRDEGNHRHFYVEIISNRGGNFSYIGKRPGVFDLGDDGQPWFAVFLNLERGYAIVPDQTR